MEKGVSPGGWALCSGREMEADRGVFLGLTRRMQGLQQRRIGRSGGFSFSPPREAEGVSPKEGAKGYFLGSQRKAKKMEEMARWVFVES